MSSRRRILVTGHKGYIGSVLAPHLVKCGHDVVGLDVGYFNECTLTNDALEIPSLDKDLRAVVPGDLASFDTVVHLAALSNDPVGNLSPAWTADINRDASVRLAEHARTAGVRRFLFSSSCIMYGLSDAPTVNETSPLDPRTEYAKSKVEAERAITTLARDGFSPTFLRNGTVYGVSPRMRFDTVFNELLGAAYTEKAILVQGNGTQWRPVVHVDDVAGAFAAVIDSPLDKVHNQAFNVGSNALNVQVSDLVRAAVATIPECSVRVLRSQTADQRSYRAEFAKFTGAFPGVTFRTPSAGAIDLRRAFEAIPLTSELFHDGRFTRLKWLRRLLESGRVDPSLRWATAGVGR